MQKKVGIVRVESELEEAVEKIGALSERAQAVSAPGNREYNPGWHTALDLHNLMVVSEAVARAGLMRRESRGRPSSATTTRRRTNISARSTSGSPGDRTARWWLKRSRWNR